MNEYHFNILRVIQNGLDQRFNNLENQAVKDGVWYGNHEMYQTHFNELVAGMYIEQINGDWVVTGKGKRAYEDFLRNKKVTKPPTNAAIKTLKDIAIGLLVALIAGYLVYKFGWN